MATDPTLTKHVLAVLSLHDGRPVTEGVITADTELRSARALTRDNVVELLQFLRDQGFADCRLDVFRQNTWFITAQGKTLLAGL